MDDYSYTGSGIDMLLMLYYTVISGKLFGEKEGDKWGICQSLVLTPIYKVGTFNNYKKSSRG
jgi:hypothetical protein